MQGPNPAIVARRLRSQANRRPRDARESVATCGSAAGGLLLRRSLALAGSIRPLVLGPRVVVDLEGLLLRPLRLRDVREVDADPVPERRPPTHAVDEDVRDLERCSRIGVLGLPAVQAL